MGPQSDFPTPDTEPGQGFQMLSHGSFPCAAPAAAVLMELCEAGTSGHIRVTSGQCQV